MKLSRILSGVVVPALLLAQPLRSPFPFLPALQTPLEPVWWEQLQDSSGNGGWLIPRGGELHAPDGFLGERRLAHPSRRRAARSGWHSPAPLRRCALQHGVLPRQHHRNCRCPTAPSPGIQRRRTGGDRLLQLGRLQHPAERNELLSALSGADAAAGLVHLPACPAQYRGLPGSPCTLDSANGRWCPTPRFHPHVRSSGPVHRFRLPAAAPRHRAPATGARQPLHRTGIQERPRYCRRVADLG